MKLITEGLLDKVTDRAKENSRLRMNYNFHDSMDAPIHRMLNALEPGTYLPPHRHKNPDKEEVYLVLRGSLLAILFDDEGNVTEKVHLNPAEGHYGIEIPPCVWHTIVVLESGTVIFEIVEEIGQKLGKQIAGLINLFNPELVIIGGTISLTGDYITQPIKTAVRKYSLNLVNKDSAIVTSKLKDRAGIVGACMLARSRMFEC